MSVVSHRRHASVLPKRDASLRSELALSEVLNEMKEQTAACLSAASVTTEG
jgi:hypothetical protein